MRTCVLVLVHPAFVLLVRKLMFWHLFGFMGHTLFNNSEFNALFECECGWVPVLVLVLVIANENLELWYHS